MEHAVSYWIGGLAVAICGGRIFAPVAIRCIRDGSTSDWAWKVGVIESACFAAMIGLGIQGIAPAMMLWISAKMAAGWNLHNGSDDDAKRARFGALAGGLVSMGFAAIGGTICAVGSGLL